MTWVFAVLLALAVFVVLAFVLKAPRRGWEAIGTALLLGIAGYALQANPDMPGAPKAAQEQGADGSSDALLKARRTLAGQEGLPTDEWLVLADALARHGQFAEAANVLSGAVEKRPGSGEAWLALANALVAHAEGVLTPASLHAYQHAADAAPDDPGPPFFLGLALAQSGRLTEARGVWSQLLERSPDDAPWRPDLELRLSRLDEFIAGQERALEGR